MSLYALVGDNFNSAHESHQTEVLNDVHINLGQKQLTTPVCLVLIKLQIELLGKVEEIT